MRSARAATIAATIAVALAVGATGCAIRDTGTPTAAPAPPTTSSVRGITPESIPTALAPLPVRAEPLAPTVDCAYGPDPQGQPAARPTTVPPTGGVSARSLVTLTLETGDGAIPLRLDRTLAPCTVNSMVALARQGYFDATVCHRLTTTPGLQVLQCGDPTGRGTGGPGYTVPDELAPGTTYGRGTLAMANTGQPDTGGSQFFIVYGDGSALDQQPNYTVFGSVGEEGLQVVDTIARRGHDGSLDPSPGGGAPVSPVTIERATLS